MVVSSKNLSVTVGLDVRALDHGWSRKNQVPDQSPLGHVAQETHGMRRQSWGARYEACRTFVERAPAPLLALAESAVRPCRPPRHPGCLKDVLSLQRRNNSWPCLKCTSICTAGKVRLPSRKGTIEPWSSSELHASIDVVKVFEELQQIGIGGGGGIPVFDGLFGGHLLT